MLRSIRLGLMFLTLLEIPCHQPLQFVAVGTVALEGILIKKALSATTQADLVAMPRCPHRPAHAAMPATAKQHCRPGQAGSHQA